MYFYPRGRRAMTRHLSAIMAGVALIGVVAAAQQAPDSAGRDWPYPQADPGGSRYSTLTQINPTNVKTLQRAWTFRTGAGRFASAPMVIDSVMYFSAPNGVYAIDAV